MADSLLAPSISVLIPAYERKRELRLCLEGFRNQTLATDEFEIIVVDDGSFCDLEPVIAGTPGLRIQFRKSEHGGPSIARNIALGIARAPLLLLYDDDLQPLPELLEYCLEFHRRYPASYAAALLYFTNDSARTISPFEAWAFTRVYPFPPAPGVYDWPYFWSGSLTCKRDLLAGQAFNPRYRSVEDAELALRLSRSCGLRVHFEPRPFGLFSRRLTFDSFCRRQRQMGYYRFLLTADYPEQIEYVHPVYTHPERHLVYDRILLHTAEALAALGGSTASNTASSLWTRAENHAIATGWLAAQHGTALEAL